MFNRCTVALPLANCFAGQEHVCFKALVVHLQQRDPYLLFFG